MHVIVYTDSLPSSTSYRFSIFDKYDSTSNYGTSVYKTGTLTRPASGYSVPDQNSILWRPQKFKEYRTTSGPFRFTINSNYEYLSDYNEATNSPSTSTDGIAIYFVNLWDATYAYRCFVKEYLPGKKTLYN